ncbi:coiled-coil domain-containing protein 137 [Triplophysa rosa]|uniref:Coiled-coil domain-containing protein 137 n=1 Tax=Triplophysa rosa TaxID=992332 RepID=A0A9W7TQH7_TRIRA|nr:coiled-coil domain-containing protein 137 [Triplophysa rosa]KAI7803395.1 coiled-coil domain-containing protein 137 [Triplophysa rosa]
MKTDKQQKQQKQEKRKKSKDHVNPASDDHLQQIPQRLREIMKSKEMMKMGSRHRKKASKPKPGEQGDIPVPHFRKRKGESKKAYVHRMTQESEHVLFLTNNQIDRKPEIEKPEKELKKHEKQTEEEKTTKRRACSRAKLQQEKKKLAQREKREEEEMFTDEVQFGEVAMAPPSLIVKPKKATVKPQGAYKGLLLNSLLGHSPVSVTEPSMARKRIMEEERERVVQLYRQMKKKRMDKNEKDRR